MPQNVHISLRCIALTEVYGSMANFAKKKKNHEGNAVTEGDAQSKVTTHYPNENSNFPSFLRTFLTFALSLQVCEGHDNLSTGGRNLNFEYFLVLGIITSSTNML